MQIEVSIINSVVLLSFKILLAFYGTAGFEDLCKYLHF